MYNYEKTKKITKVKIPLGVFAVVLLFILYSPLVYADTLKEGVITAGSALMLGKLQVLRPHRDQL